MKSFFLGMSLFVSSGIVMARMPSRTVIAEGIRYYNFLYSTAMAQSSLSTDSIQQSIGLYNRLSVEGKQYLTAKHRIFCGVHIDQLKIEQLDRQGFFQSDGLLDQSIMYAFEKYGDYDEQQRIYIF